MIDGSSITTIEFAGAIPDDAAVLLGLGRLATEIGNTDIPVHTPFSLAAEATVSGDNQGNPDGDDGARTREERDPELTAPSSPPPPRPPWGGDFGGGFTGGEFDDDGDPDGLRRNEDGDLEFVQAYDNITPKDRIIRKINRHSRNALPLAERLNDLSDAERPAAILVLVHNILTAQAVGDEATQGALVAALADVDANKISETIEAFRQLTAAGVLNARDMLERQLRISRNMTQRELAELEAQDREENSHHRVEDTALSIIIDAEQSLGREPNEWIDRYAVNEEAKWRLYLRHYMRIYNGEAKTGEADLTRLVDELVAAERFPASFVIGVAPDALRLLPTHALRSRVLEQFIAVDRVQPSNSFELVQSADTGAAMIYDQGLRTPQRIDTFKARLDHIRTDLVQQGANDTALHLFLTRWDIAYEWQNGADPETLIANLQDRVENAYRATGHEVIDPDIHDEISSRLDSHFTELANLHARFGDYSGTAAFLNAIGNRQQAAQLLHGHLSSMHSLEAIRSFRESLGDNPDYGRQILAKLALMNDNVDELYSAAEDIVRRRTGIGTVIDNHHLYQLVLGVAKHDRPRALQLAQSVSTGLRGMGGSWEAIVPFEALLLKAAPFRIASVISRIESSSDDMRAVESYYRLIGKLKEVPNLSEDPRGDD